MHVGKEYENDSGRIPLRFKDSKTAKDIPYQYLEGIVQVDMRVPNEMVRLRMRNKQEVPKHEIPGKPSDFVYLYQNCTAKSKQGDLLDITVQYRFDRESSYDIVYPPMVVPQGNDTCASVRNVAAYCKCSSKGNSK